MEGSTIIRSRVGYEGHPRKKHCNCGEHCHQKGCVTDITGRPMFRPFASDPDEIFFRGASPVGENGYSISIVKDNHSAASFTKDGHRYFRLRNKTEYSVKLSNNTDQPANVVLKIDSVTMGKWRISAKNSVQIERPVHSQRKFTFVREDCGAAREGGVEKGAFKNGLVEATFIPLDIDISMVGYYSPGDPHYENNRRSKLSDIDYSHALPINNSVPLRTAGSHRGIVAQNYNGPVLESASSFSANSYSVGATVLGEDSDQRYRKASNQGLTELHDMKVVKRIRIVVDNRKRFAHLGQREPPTDVPYYEDPVPPRLPTNRPLGHRSNNRETGNFQYLY